MTTFVYRTALERRAVMSAVSLSAQRRAEQVSVRKLVWAAPLAGLLAALGNLAVYGLARAGLSLPLAMPAMGPTPAGPLLVAPVILASFVPALFAGGLLALLARLSARPVRTFQIIAGVALVLSLGAPLTLPVDTATRLVLLVMHLVAGLVIAGVLGAKAVD
jgi:hypothetical protein